MHTLSFPQSNLHQQSRTIAQWAIILETGIKLAGPSLSYVFADKIIEG